MFWGSLAICYVLQLMPLPPVLLPFKPFWLALVLIYWSLETPERVGLGLMFCLGLLGDVLAGELLGEQAARLCVLGFIVLRFRPRLRFFPMWQQSLAVLALLLNDRVFLMMIHAFAGDPIPPASFWLAPPAGAVAKPWLFLLLDDLRARLRVHEARHGRTRAMNTPSPRTALKDARHESALFRTRAIAGFLLIVACLSVLAARFFYLQVNRHDEFIGRSDSNRISIRTIVPSRGLIYDRNGVLLADNVAAFRLEVVPEQVPHMDAMLEHQRSRAAER